VITCDQLPPVITGDPEGRFISYQNIRPHYAASFLFSLPRLFSFQMQFDWPNSLRIMDSQQPRRNPSPSELVWYALQLYVLISLMLCSQICLGNIQSPFSTSCGHSFCHDCIFRQLDYNACCPTCKSPLAPDDIFPNFACTATMMLRFYMV